jgi:hypothetical protein
VNWLANLLETILTAIFGLRQGQSDQNLNIAEIQSALTQQSETLQTILGFLQPPRPVALEITFEGESIMAKRKATVDFQLLDNGTATATLTPVDAAGNPTTMPAGATVPAWTSSSPGIAITAAADGMSATLTPTGLGTGIIISANSTLSDGVTTLTGSGNPIDVVAGSASAFAIAEQDGTNPTPTPTPNLTPAQQASRRETLNRG